MYLFNTSTQCKRTHTKNTKYNELERIRDNLQEIEEGQNVV